MGSLTVPGEPRTPDTMPAQDPIHGRAWSCFGTCWPLTSQGMQYWEFSHSSMNLCFSPLLQPELLSSSPLTLQHWIISKENLFNGSSLWGEGRTTGKPNSGEVLSQKRYEVSDGSFVILES